MARNIIYYGPPGTGKTYFMQKETEKYTNYSISDSKIMEIFYRESQEWLLFTLIILQNNEGMLPTDIIKKAKLLINDFEDTVSQILQEHSIGQQFTLIEKKEPQIFHLNNNYWYVDRVKLLEFKPDFFNEYFDDDAISTRFDFVTFHQSFSYEDFVEGIRPSVIPETGNIDYSPQNGVFKQICEKARRNPNDLYAIFIDEINRGNISEIFGELISLIETDKREKMPAELKVVLPYSKTEFTVPSNLNIIGSMNTADRSVVSIDIALRRRFEFIPFLCDYIELENELSQRGLDANDIEGIDVIALLKVINMRIQLLLDSNFTIGHTYFININNFQDIKNVITKKILPLLEEYFFDDPQKIQMVLNDIDEYGELDDNPIYIHESLESENLLRFTEDYMLETKRIYRISSEISLDSIKKIYDGVAL